ncbi:LysR family transcriptional regulator [Streptomyces sparsogenes]|uniref:LysR family transcriptional regulator n=1 Tax=Streptomyces sparsogenes TaxID=67365 RepID=UPI0033CB518B
MELRHLRYALVLAEHEHFGRAAAALGIQQPPLSMQIKALESEVGVQLFERTGRGVHPTLAGQAFLKRAREALDQVTLAAREAVDAERGTSGSLAIGFLGTALGAVMPEVFTVYRERFPYVRLQLREMPSIEQVDALLHGDLDAGFVCGPVPRGAREQLTTIPVARESLVAVVAADHEFAREPLLSAAALEGQPLVLPARRKETAAFEAAWAMCRAAGFEPQDVTEVSGLHTLLGFVACGLGVGVGPAGMRRFRHVGTTIVPIEATDARLDIHLAFRSRDKERVLRNFLAVVRGLTPV